MFDSLVASADFQPALEAIIAIFVLIAGIKVAFIGGRMILRAIDEDAKREVRERRHELY